MCPFYGPSDDAGLFPLGRSHGLRNEQMQSQGTVASDGIPWGRTSRLQHHSPTGLASAPGARTVDRVTSKERLIPWAA